MWRKDVEASVVHVGEQLRGTPVDRCTVSARHLDREGLLGPRTHEIAEGREAHGEAAIVPIIIGETADAMALSARLLDEGVFVTGFGFPVVPEGTARIRVQMSAALEREHLERAIDAFRRVRPD